MPQPESPLPRVFLLSLALVFAGIADAAPPRKDDPERRVRATFERLFPKIGNIRIEPTVMPGIYEVTIPGGDVVYASADGKHFLVGAELYLAQGDSFINLSEIRQSRIRRQAMADIAPDDFITFQAKNERTVINVFTDVDCTYCRKIHQEVPELNKLGVTVRYLAYPRAGIGSPAYQRAVTAWCARNKQAVLTDLKARKAVPIALCDKNPVAQQYQLGGQLGVRGTPAIVLESGRLLPGYMPAKDLARAAGIDVK